ncbi:unnamed protein product [Brassicogethes aeneus]|uniref:UDP-glucuronosyltransferase n=1 Tax=Brassicogethes aeneus TaxID=1431903 RepID=A0A9P0F8C1_BRAAE|nr:unnamed protein product [Brassicogethes aeneus]
MRFLVLFFVSFASASNIFYISNIPSPSHHLWHMAIISGLNAKGHNVTFFDPYDSKNKETELFHPVFFECPSFVEEFQDISKLGIYDSFQFFYQAQKDLCKNLFEAENLKNLIISNKFDALIMDITAPCSAYMSQAFPEIPIIGAVPFLLPPELSHIFGNNLQPAYLPHYFSGFSSEMNFMERVKNFLLTYYGEVGYYSYSKDFEELGRIMFGSDLKPFSENVKRVSLLLSNTNPVFDNPQPLPPNIIPVGGLHARPGRKLEKDLEDLLNRSSNGVIVFSLGSNVKSSALGTKKIQIFLEAFKQLKQTVIWKFESDLKDLPKNVFIKKWLPQNDIIAHSNVKVFMGHGGALSTQEAFYHGVPVIGIPFFFDQHVNVKSLVERKQGLKIDINNLSKEAVLNTILEVLNNPIYKENVQEVSKRFKDQPMTPLDSSVFWIEYAIKHNGTSFHDLKSRDMSFLEFTCLDVLLFLLFVTMLFITLVYYIILVILKLIFRKSNKNKIE